MERELISDALDLLDDTMIAHTDKLRKRKNKRLTLRTPVEFCTAAACLCLILITAAVLPSLLRKGAAAGLQDSFDTENRQSDTGRFPDSVIGQSGLSGTPDSTVEQGGTDELSAETFVSIASLLASDSGDAPDSNVINTQALLISFVPVGSYTGIYTNVSAGADLSACLGAAVPETEAWYYVSGHRDMQYLIQNTDGTYTLWKFQCFTGDSYPYSDVLKLVYQLESADGIASIQVAPPTMINSDAGKKLQEQIGSSTVTDRTQIESVYQVLSTLTCYGSNRWDIIDYGSAEASADGAGPLDAVRLGRYLSLVTTYGNEIDGLKYTAVSDMFYEYSGIAYNTLSEEQAQEMCEILGIETE